MNSTTYLSSTGSANVAQDHGSFGQENSSASTGLPAPLFHNPCVAVEAFLEKAKQFCDAQYLLVEKWFKAPLPKLEKNHLIACVELLACSRIIKGRGNSFEVSFTLLDLFQHLLSKGSLETVELIGGAVPWILKDYLPTVLAEMGVEKPEEWLPEAILNTFSKAPRDFDFRLFAPHASDQEVKVLRDSILEFIVEKQAEKEPELDKKAFKKKVYETGFALFTNPEEVDGNLFTTVGIKDHVSGQGLDIVIYQKLNRESLFIKDSLRIPLKELLAALNTCTSQELIEKIKAGGYHPVIIPCSDCGSGRQALFDRAAGLLRAVNAKSINCAGWAAMLVNYVKGERSFDAGLESLLLDRIRRSLEGLTNPFDMPPALHKQLISIRATPENLQKRLAIAVAYWLEKAIHGHLGGQPNGAAVLTLQACLSLKENGYTEAAEDLWQHMKVPIGKAEQGICPLIQAMMKCGKGEISAVISLIETKAFLSLSAKDFSAELIMHKQKPAIRAVIDGMYLLLPYHPAASLAQCLSSPQLDSQLEKMLLPQSPYCKNTHPHDQTQVTFKNAPDFSCPGSRLAFEWILAAEVQHKTVHGSAWLEQVLPEWLHNASKEQWQRILQSIENKDKSAEEKKIYSAMRYMCAKSDYANMPIRMVWALALTAAEDSARCRTAYLLWQKHHAEISKELKEAYAKVFIKKLCAARPDLAAEVFTGFETATLLDEIQQGYEKNPYLLNTKGLKLLADAVKKMKPSPVIKKAAGWIMVNLIDREEYGEAYAVSQCAGLCPLFIAQLQQNPSQVTIITQLIDSQLSNLEETFTLLLALKPASASRWQVLFNRIKASKDKELCLKAWKVFQTFALTGSPYEITEAWSSAIKAMEKFEPKALFDLIGKETVLSQIPAHPLNTTFSLHIYLSLLNAIKETRSTAQLEPLLRTRENMAALLHAPVGQTNAWKEADRLLADLISDHTSTKMQMAAFTIYVELELDGEAEKPLLSLLQKTDMSKIEEPFLNSLVRFCVRLPKDKQALAMQILTASEAGTLFKKSPKNFLAVLLDWLVDETAPSKLTLQIFRHALMLYPLVEDSSKLIGSISSLIFHVDKQDKLPKHSELRTFLVRHHDQIVALLEVENRDAEKLKFLSSIKRLSLDIKFSAVARESYYKTFLACLSKEIQDLFLWMTDDMHVKYHSPNCFHVCIHLINELLINHLEKEAQPLLKKFIAHVKDKDLPHIFANPEALHPTLCKLLLRQAEDTENAQVKMTACQIFWEYYIVKGALNIHPKEHVQTWMLFFRDIYTGYPGIFFVILKDLPTLKTALDTLENKDKNEISDRILQFAADLSWNISEANRQEYLQRWIEVKELLLPHLEKVIVPEVSIHLLIGNSVDYVWGIDQLSSMLLLPNDYQFYLHMAYLLSHMGKDRAAQIVKLPLFHQFINKLCATPKEGYLNVLDVLLSTTVELLSIDEALQFIDGMIQPTDNADKITVFSMLLLRMIMSNTEMTSEQSKKCLSHISMLFKEVRCQGILFPHSYASELTRFPPTFCHQYKNEEEKDKILFFILRIIEAINGPIESNMDLKENWVSNAKKMIEHCKTYTSLILSDKYRENCCSIVFRLLNGCHATEAKPTGPIRKAFLDSVVKTLRNQYSPKEVNLRLNNIHLLYIEFYLNAGYRECLTYLINSDSVRDEFMTILESKDIDAERFFEALHGYAFQWEVDMTDALYDTGRLGWLDRHYDNVRQVILKACRKNMQISPARLFGYHILYDFHTKALDNIPAMQKEAWIMEMFNQFLSRSTYYGMTHVLVALSQEFLSPETLTHYFQRLLTMAATVTFVPKEGQPIIASIMAAFYEIKQFSKQTISLEWQEALTLICRAFIKQLCNPNLPCEKNQKIPVDLLRLASRVVFFLQQAYHAQFFAGKITAYFNMIEIFIQEIKPQLTKNLADLNPLTVLILHALPLATSEGKVEAAKVMTMWIKTLADINLQSAQQALALPEIASLYGYNDATALQLIEAQGAILANMNHRKKI